VAVLFRNSEITLFNRVYDVDTDTETWEKTLFNGVRVIKQIGGNNTAKSGNEDISACKVYIPFSILQKTYIEPLAYKELTDKSDVFTFDSEHDFFVVGDYSDITVSATNFYEEMRNKYDGVSKITQYAEYRNVLPHYEISGV